VTELAQSTAAGVNVANPQLGRVILWMTGALFSFMASALAIRTLGKKLNVFEILTIRSGLGLLVLLAFATAYPALRQDIRPRWMALHFGRNTTHFVGQYLWALAVTLLPFATVFALEFTTPAWVALLAALFLKERMTLSRAGSVVLGFLGVVTIVRPGLASFQPLALLVLLAALAFAISLIVTKKLTAHVSTFAVVFWMNAIQLPLAFGWPLLKAVTGEAPLFVFRMGADAILPTVVLGIVGLTSHYCLAQAFRFGDATVVVPLDFLRIPLIALVGWMFYGEVLDAFVFAGAGLIICGVLWNLRAEARRSIAAGTERAQAVET
jgi:drug/metabolite transporter (DMT)-like permease